MSEIFDEILMQIGNYANEINYSIPTFPEISNSFLTSIQKINSDLKPFDNILRISHINAVSISKHRTKFLEF